MDEYSYNNTCLYLARSTALNNTSISPRYLQFPFYHYQATSHLPASLCFLCAFVSKSLHLLLFAEGWPWLLSPAMSSCTEAKGAWEFLPLPKSDGVEATLLHMCNLVFLTCFLPLLWEPLILLPCNTVIPRPSPYACSLYLGVLVLETIFTCPYSSTS